MKASVKCLKPFSTEYLIANRHEKFIKNLIASSRAVGGNSRGYTLALSHLSRDIYSHFVIFN